MAYTTIDDPSLYFRVKTYSGSSSDGNAITWDETDTNMSPNFLWLKNRTSAQEHWLCDTVRGTGKFLESNSNNAESSDGASGFASFDSNGFTLNDSARTNRNTMVAWGWKESTNAGFDIVGYTGNATDDVDISHSLSAVPHVIIVKNRSNTNNESWAVYHHKNTSAPETDFLKLDTTAATADNDEIWSDEAPTSSVFTIGRQDMVNGSSNTQIAYLWSEKQGFSKFGSYTTGNGNNDGAFVYTGMKISWLMVKKTNSASNNEWIIWDNKRSTFNMVEKKLAANLTNAETDASWVGVDFLSNGFKFRSNDSIFNGSGDTYVYMAFAEAPFVNSKGVSCNAR